ncbi:cytidylate kinase-like family protein [Porphyromonadaceae bacterium W3.11]|nr:cytidylate kinase-like family protein [Porphyromonadaceae bacterium W3.11]
MAENKHNHFALCIGRSFGSGGLKLAMSLQERLGIKVYEKNILDKAAEDANIRKALFEKADEENKFNMPIVYGAGLGIPNSFFIYTNNYLSNEHLFTMQAETIERLAEQESAIFVGRCADYVLRDHPQLLSIFVADTLESRVKNVMERLSLESEDEAISEIEKADKKRREYYTFYTSRNWGEACNYDLCLRLSDIGTDYAVNIIVELMKHKGFIKDK